MLQYKQPITSAIYTRVYFIPMSCSCDHKQILPEGAESSHLWSLCPMGWRRYDPCHFDVFIYLFFENSIHVSSVLWSYPPTPLSSHQFLLEPTPPPYSPCNLISSFCLLRLASSVCIHYISMTKTCHKTSPSTKKPGGAAQLCS